MSSCDLSPSFVEEKIKRIKRKERVKRGIVASLVLFLCILLISSYFSKVVNPVVMSYASGEIEKMLVKASNNAVLSLSTVKYDDLIDTTYKDGEIVSITANSSVINSLANALAIETQRELDLQSTTNLKIPIGTVSGIAFLTGKGFNVTFDVQPIGNVTCSFSTSFTSSGINQTIHKIFVLVNSSAMVALPFNSQKVSKTIEYLVAECLIVGNVPQTYINVTSLGELCK